MNEANIETSSLRLVLETPEIAREQIARLTPAERSELSADWLALVDSATSADPWIHGFSLLRRMDDAAVGSCGFKGPPTPDGTVEIAYGIAPDHQGNGYATEAAQALVSYAFSHGVRVVRAHTMPELNASTRVLTKCGFRHIGEVIDPDDGPVWRWEKDDEGARSRSMNPLTERPSLVEDALRRADKLGFPLSCEDYVGRLLAVLAASAPPNARILELGTGAGVSLAWIASGLSHRDDVTVITVDTDPDLLREVGRSEWPNFVQFVEGDGSDEVSRHGRFDLLFADAPGGKLSNMAGTIAALQINGLLVLDDMDLDDHADDPELREQIAELTATLLSDRRLLCLETPTSSGVLLAVRRE